MSKQGVVQAKAASADLTRSALGVLQRRGTLGSHACVGRQASQEPGPEAASLVREVVDSPGRPLDAVTRARMEPRFGYSFDRVRLHTDDRAAGSARAVEADAYTLGNHVVFGAGKYSPGTSAGQSMIAHELAHVVQQRGTWNGAQPLVVGCAESHSEREAHQAAMLADTNRVAPVEGRQSTGIVQRTVAGDIGGGLAGAAAGAALGSLGGVGGAIVGGLLGGVAGAFLGDVLTAEKRELIGPERTAAKMVFGTSLDLGPVRVAEAPLMSAGGYARTPFNTIYFPPGTLAHLSIPWLIHELTHVWQTQHGISVLTKVWWALHGASAYPYGGEDALKTDAAAGKRFTDYNTEQQAEIMKDYYMKKSSGEDDSAYLPFVEQVQGKSPEKGREGRLVPPAGSPEQRFA